MRSSNHDEAGSIPEAVLAQGTLRFDEEFLASPGLTEFQHEVGSRLLRIMLALPAESVASQAGIGGIGGLPGSTVIVSFVPRQKGCAQMTVYIEPDTRVHIGVGEGTTYSLPHDVWDPRAKDVSRFTEQIVSAVVGGKFRETVHYRGRLPVRWVSELRIEETPVPQDRTELLARLRGVLRKRTKREVTYLPYS